MSAAVAVVPIVLSLGACADDPGEALDPAIIDCVRERSGGSVPDVDHAVVSECQELEG